MNEEVKITALPTPPSTSDAASFDERADTFLAALPNFADELNEFGKKISTETKERIESTIKTSIDTRLDENDERLKKELVSEVAQQTSALKRTSVRLLNVPMIHSSGVLSEDFTAYQIVTRLNDESNEIVDFGDVIVPLYKTSDSFTAPTFNQMTRLPLPKRLKELVEWKNITVQQNYALINYTSYLHYSGNIFPKAFVEGAETIEMVEGDTLTRSQSEVNSFAISAVRLLLCCSASSRRL